MVCLYRAVASLSGAIMINAAFKANTEHATGLCFGSCVVSSDNSKNVRYNYLTGLLVVMFIRRTVLPLLTV
jgi:hypothetical protein